MMLISFNCFSRFFWLADPYVSPLCLNSQPLGAGLTINLIQFVYIAREVIVTLSVIPVCGPFSGWAWAATLTTHNEAFYWKSCFDFQEMLRWYFLVSGQSAASLSATSCPQVLSFSSFLTFDLFANSRYCLLTYSRAMTLATSLV